MFFGDGVTTCPGCGAALTEPQPVDAEGKRWQSYCYKNLRCEKCGGAKTRLYDGSPRNARCEKCYKHDRPFFDWLTMWGDVGRQVAVEYQKDQYDARRLRAQQAAHWRVYCWVWGEVGRDYERRCRAWPKNLGYNISVVGLAAHAYARWRRRWLKMWGRLGAHVLRDAQRFGMGKNFDSPEQARFSQIELD